MDLISLDRFIKDKDLYLKNYLINYLNEKFQFNQQVNATIIQIPNCLSSNQLKCLQEKFNDNEIIDEKNLILNWFYPNIESISIEMNPSSDLSTKNIYYNNGQYKICLNLFNAIKSIKSSLLFKCLIKQTYNNNQQRFGGNNNNFNLFTYFDTKPIIPKFINKQQQNDGLSSIFNSSILLTELQSTRIQILNGLTKNDRLELLIDINNDCAQKQRTCRIVYLQSSTIMTFWMASALKQMSNDRWNSIGYQIMLESKTSLNNSIIFFEMVTFIRAITKDLDINLMTHLIIDIMNDEDMNSLYLNLFILYLKENLMEINNLYVIFLTSQTKYLNQIINYFNTYDDRIYFKDFCINNQQQYCNNLRYFFIEDFQQLINTNDLNNNQNDQNQINHSELIINECWNGIVNVDKMIEFFRLYPWQINKRIDNDDGITPLITAIVRGTYKNVQQLLQLGADPFQKSQNVLQPIQWAIKSMKRQTFQLLFTHLYIKNVSFDLHIERIFNLNLNSTNNTTNQQQQLTLYHTKINYNLIIQILYLVIRQMYHDFTINHFEYNHNGSILIMLPSYNHVSTLRKIMIQSLSISIELQQQIEFTIFCLYPNVPNNELDAGIEIFQHNNNQHNHHIRIILSTFNVDTILFQDIYCIINTGRRLIKIPTIFTTNVSLYRMIPNPSENQEMKFFITNNNQFNQVIICNLYSRDEFLDYDDNDQINNNVFNIKSNDSLCHCIFAAKCFKFKNIDNLTQIFNRMILPPNRQIIYRTIRFMQSINVLDKNENITTLGRMLMDISIEPHYAKMIIMSIILRCLDPILTIVCTLSSPQSVYKQFEYLLHMFDEDHHQPKRISKNSDHLNFVYAFQKWQEITRLNAKSSNHNNGNLWKKAKILMNQNYDFKESLATYEWIYSLRTKILGQLRAIGLVKGKGVMNIKYLNTNSDNYSLILATIISGQLYDHFANINNCNNELKSINPNEIIYIESNSIINMYLSSLNNKNNWMMMFDRKIECGQISCVQTCTIINPITYFIFVDDNTMEYNLNDKCIESMNGRFQFYNNNDDANDYDNENGNDDLEKLFEIRQCLQQLMKRRLDNIQQVFNDEEDYFLENLINLLTMSDESLYGFEPHLNIGRAPQVMSTYFCSTIRIKK